MKGSIRGQRLRWARRVWNVALTPTEASSHKEQKEQSVVFSVSRVIKGFGIIGLVLGVSAGAYGFTAANNVPTSYAGDGSGAVSGYTVTAIHYVLNAGTPTNVTKVTFTVNAAPAAGSTMQVQIGGHWYACTNAGANLSCDTTVGTQLTIANATTLEALIAS
jgi:hypothetical protein